MADTETQRAAFEDSYEGRDELRWSFHFTQDSLVRYLRDRRLNIAMQVLAKQGCLRRTEQSVLVVCGGVGGEGTFLRKFGFADVTVSDFSAHALRLCNRFDPCLKTQLLDAEQVDVPDSSYDIVLVQDGLHHLPRPTLGFTEMLRVAREAVVVIEPHSGLAGSLMGTEWEVQGEAVNYVFRWDGKLLKQCALSYLLSCETRVVARRVWDHNVVVGRLVGRLPRVLRVPAARGIYAALTPLAFAGNNMVGVVIKG